MNQWNDQLQTRLAELLTALMDRQLTTAERRELNDILRAHPEARDQTIRALALHAQLHARLAEARPEDVTIASPEISPLHASAHSDRQQLLRRFKAFVTRPTPLSLTAAFLAVACMLGLLAIIAPPFYRAVRSTIARPVVVPQAEDVVARVTAVHEAQFMTRQLERGSQLSPNERLQITRGLVAIEYTTGERVILEGPAVFEVNTHPDRQNCGSGWLRSGRLAALVPPTAVGFSIETPTAVIVDLGTEFGVVVHGDGTDVHVFAGKVKARSISDASESETVVIEAGQARRVPADGVRPESIELAAAEFSRAMPASERQRDPYYAAVMADRPVGYWRLNDRGTTLARNAAGRPHGLYRGDVQLGTDARPGDPQFEEQQRSAHFDGKNDYVEIEYDAGLNPEDFTLETWFRLDRVPADFASLITSRNSGQGTAGYIIYITRTGQCEFWTGNGQTWSMLKGPSLEVGQWTHIAATFQRIRTLNNGTLTGIACLYVDGQQAARQEGFAYVPLQMYSRPLRIGAGSSEADPPQYFFPGQISDAAIYDRALTLEEIDIQVRAARVSAPDSEGGDLPK